MKVDGTMSTGSRINEGSISFADSGLEPKEAARIERMRRLEEDRKARIFNSRERQMGVDRAALEAQIAEKKAQKEREAELDKAYASQLMMMSKQMETIELQKSALRKQAEARVNAERAAQAQESRSPAPFSHAADAPEVFENAPAGVASGQVWEGEDLEKAQREREQAEQRRRWAEAQSAEKAARAAHERAMHARYEKQVEEMEARRQEIEANSLRARREAQAATMEANRLMAEAKKAAAARAAAEEAEAEAAEKAQRAAAFAKLQQEEAALRGDAPHRVVPSEFRGMSRAQIAQVEAERAAQVEAVLARKAAEKAEDEKWESSMSAAMRVTAQATQEAAARRAAMAAEIREENLRLAQEAKARNASLAAEYEANRPGEEFFSQFNKSSR